MPVRQNTKRVPSDEVQGEGSFVEIKRLTYGEIKMLRTASDDRLTQSADVVRTVVVNWNWVDDAGQPLPLPSADPDVLDLLTDAEIGFIGKALGAETEKKAQPRSS